MLTKFKETLFKKAHEKGFTDAEIYFSKSETFQIKIHEQEISEYKQAQTNGVSFRGTFGGKMAYAFSENLSLEVIDTILNSAITNSEILDEKEQETLFAGENTYKQMNCYSQELADFNPELVIQYAKKMEQSAKDYDKRVKAVDYCVFAISSSQTSIMNSYGLDVTHKSNNAYAYAYTRVTEDGNSKLGFDYWVSKDLKTFDPVKVGRESAKEALAGLGATSVTSGNYKILFDKYAFIDLFQTFAGIFHADSVQKGFSLLKGKIGEKIASQIVTINDDCQIDGGLANTPFDSEGVATKNKIVVENGILKTHLHNTKTAKKEGIKSTGNGFKPSFKGSVKVSEINFYIQNGEKSQKHLMEEMQNGILIKDLSGLHSGANSVSGDFSLLADGFLIENGKITKPVEQITVSGNFFDLLLDIKNIGNDLSFGIGNIGSPSVLVGKLSIAGE